MKNAPEFYHVHPEVKQAQAEGRPVVALESTVITHGLPYPDNLATARSMETAVRHGGAVPATIAILRGQIHIGLTAAQLEYLATRPGSRCANAAGATCPWSWPAARMGPPPSPAP